MEVRGKLQKWYFVTPVDEMVLFSSSTDSKPSLAELEQSIGRHSEYKAWIGEIMRQNDPAEPRLQLDPEKEPIAVVGIVEESTDLKIREGIKTSRLKAIMVKQDCSIVVETENSYYRLDASFEEEERIVKMLQTRASFMKKYGPPTTKNEASSLTKSHESRQE